MPKRRSRSEATAVVSRELAGDLLVTNIFGKEVPNMIICQCGKQKFKSEFYCESPSKRRHRWQVRYQCVDCWDVFKGKKVVESRDPTNTLNQYIEHNGDSNA